MSQNNNTDNNNRAAESIDFSVFLLLFPLLYVCVSVCLLTLNAVLKSFHYNDVYVDNDVDVGRSRKLHQRSSFFLSNAADAIA